MFNRIEFSSINPAPVKAIKKRKKGYRKALAKMAAWDKCF